VAVKENEINPKVLLKIIKEKRPINKIMLIFPLLRSTENSFTIALKILCRI
jgi:hypothetical protein